MASLSRRSKEWQSTDSSIRCNRRSSKPAPCSVVLLSGVIVAAPVPAVDLSLPQRRRDQGRSRGKLVPLRRLWSMHRGGGARRSWINLGGEETPERKNAMSNIIGVLLPRIGAIERVIGARPCAADMRLDDALHVEIVSRAVRARAHHRRQDRRGRCVPGVRGIFTAHDLPQPVRARAGPRRSPMLAVT